jgi:hypothetical protein
LGLRGRWSDLNSEMHVSYRDPELKQRVHPIFAGTQERNS